MPSLFVDMIKPVLNVTYKMRISPVYVTRVDSDWHVLHSKKKRQKILIRLQPLFFACVAFIYGSEGIRVFKSHTADNQGSIFNVFTWIIILFMGTGIVMSYKMEGFVQTLGSYVVLNQKLYRKAILPFYIFYIRLKTFLKKTPYT